MSSLTRLECFLIWRKLCSKLTLPQNNFCHLLHLIVACPTIEGWATTKYPREHEFKTFPSKYKEPKADNSHIDLMLQLGVADLMLPVVEILQRLGLDNVESPCPIPSSDCTKAKELASEFVSRYVDLTLPGETSVENTKV